MKSIVTGATGFIGYALCRQLLETGGEVTAVIRPMSSKKKKLDELVQSFPEYGKRLTVIELDLDEMDKLHEAYQVSADVFYHLAWNGSSGSDREDFDKQYSNIKFTADAIRTAKACGCRKFVGAGSQAEYGVVHGVSKEAATVPQPFMMYGAAKLAAYQMGQVLAAQLGISLVWPRIYSVYGVGENPGTLVNYVMDTLREGQVPELSPCENMWNFMYITDCVRALQCLGQTDSVHGICHVASKDTRILKEFVREIRDIVAPELKLGFGKKTSNPNRTFWLEPDVERLDELEFECEVGFGEGIRRKMEE